MRTPGVITKQHLAILTLIYRFRFITTRHVQQDLGQKHIQNAQRILDLLVSREFIGRHYSGQDKLLGQPASYYLLPPGMKVLKTHKPGVEADVLRTMYKDKAASAAFIRHCRAVGDINATIVSRYGREVEIYTKSEMKAYDFMPEQLPDAYVTIPDATAPDEPSQFLVEVCEAATPLWIVKRRLRQYVEYAEGGEWEDATGTKLPTIILVCENAAQQTKLQKVANQELDSTFTDDVSFVATTNELLSKIDLRTL